jgi:hypothetical protein
MIVNMLHNWAFRCNIYETIWLWGAPTVVATRLGQITDMLRILRTADGNIQASALVSAEGLMIASDLPEQVGED